MMYFISGCKMLVRRTRKALYTCIFNVSIVHARRKMSRNSCLHRSNSRSYNFSCFVINTSFIGIWGHCLIYSESSKLSKSYRFLHQAMYNSFKNQILILTSNFNYNFTKSLYMCVVAKFYGILKKLQVWRTKWN